MRAYKTVNDAYIEPIAFTVPRRAETFQSDIYPPAIGLKPAVSAQEWLNGKTALPPKIDLESIYEGSAPKEVPADYKPPTKAPEPVAKPAPKKAPEPEPAATMRSPPPSMRDQKQAVSSMVNKYQDAEEDDDDDEAETSSFEEVARPQPRTAMHVQAEAKPSSPTKATSPVLARPAQQPTKALPPKASPPITSPAPAGSSSSSSSVEASLDQIKQLLEAQTKIITSQNQKIDHLAGEVDTLKKRVGAGTQDQSERIRQLELELEAARS